MKKFFCASALLLLVLGHSKLNAQQYVWKKGSNAINQNGVYGIVGLSAPGNNPGAREGAVSWKDAAGNFWLFGGFGLDATGYNQLNDLWKYNPGNNQWTFMKGNTTGGQSGVYGSLGVPAATNKPGSRNRAVAWTDASGNLWLFGGNGYDASAQQGYLNDLWKYDPLSNNWTWMKGGTGVSQAGTYGTQGVAAIANVPGSREGAVSWADASGNLWLFGGYGLEATSNTGQLNDLWKYNISSNQWTWMKGSNSYDQNGTYGVQGTGTAANTPGGRRYSTAWTDASGQFWLLGGYGYPASGPLTGHLNDLWKYSSITNQWTWVKGSNLYDQLGVYGVQGTPAPANYPGGRVAGTAWTDAAGDLWLMGGYGFGVSVPTFDFMNDLWKYNIVSNQWTWVKGGNTISQAGVYGTQGIASPANTPGGRSNAVGWYDAATGIWLFGGNGYDTNSQSSSGFLNDLWKFGTCVSQSLSVVSSPSSICSGASATLSASGASSYVWSTSATGASVLVSPLSTSVYVVHSLDPNACGDSALILLPVHPNPSVSANSADPNACWNSTVNLFASGASSYTWNTGQTGSSILVTVNVTVYTVVGSSSAGCTGSASVIQYYNICETIAEHAADPLHFTLSPNPSTGDFLFSHDQLEESCSLYIYDYSGKMVFHRDDLPAEMTVHSALPPGLYFVRLSTGAWHSKTLKWVVE
ncbi:MAG TPA: kelch repeat-containing protein [Bacteroidia bacterium]|nr:kelch repeat-containing protein [Bacteroidia bacterium]